MLDYLKKAITSQFDMTVPEGLVVTRLEAETESILYFFFQDRSQRPFLVIKAAGHPGSVQRLEEEYGNLFRIRASLPEKLQRTIPCTHGEGRFFDHYYFIQEYVQGSMLPEEIETNRLGEPTESAARRIDLAWKWLTDFQAATSGDSRPLVWFDLHRMITRYRSAYECDAAEVDYMSVLESRLEELKHEHVVTVACHGDLFPGNVIVGKEEVTIIDWRDYRAVYHPVFDITTLLTTFRVPSNHVNDIEGNMESTLFRESGIVHKLHTSVDQLVKARGISEEIFGLLLGFSLLEWSTSEYAEGKVVTDKDLAWRRRLRCYMANRERSGVGAHWAESSSRGEA